MNSPTGHCHRRISPSFIAVEAWHGVLVHQRRRIQALDLRDPRHTSVEWASSVTTSLCRRPTRQGWISAPAIASTARRALVQPTRRGMHDCGWRYAIRELPWRGGRQEGGARYGSVLSVLHQLPGRTGKQLIEPDKFKTVACDDDHRKNGAMTVRKKLCAALRPRVAIRLV